MSDGRREARQSQRIRMAARAASTAGSAMDVALAQIGAAFDEAAALNDFKLRVERALRRGPQHPAVRARFGARAERLAGLRVSMAQSPRSSAGGVANAKRSRSQARLVTATGCRSTCCGS